ncbi:hypothetical protein GCM10009718_17780 [Isoptericola halotolerans]|uniref:Phospholipase D-like protein n=1 Tax=Isoptericola halotolerans TaxID=300560 RepID=A0ABX2A6Z6_9MICO|nr:hypothetical protein [Isoptericola halotolerans]NOV98635.1 hypothetical protein [Isoptericola halotolerans]
MDPLPQFAPVAYDVGWSVLALAALALTAWALKELWTSTWATGVAGVLWFLIVLAVPVVGPAVFLLTDRSRERLPAPAGGRHPGPRG